MLKLETLTLGDYQTNCYVVWEEASKTCAVIDPGYDPETVLARLHTLDLTLEAILLTHGHFDHVGAVKALVEATGCALWMHERDYSQFKNPTNAWFYPIANCDFTQVCFCEEAEVLQAGGLSFTVLETPGHTWGSVCYRCGDALFCGDTLFAGSCGRIDLPGGDRKTMASTLERLAGIPEDLGVYPGHGTPSTLQREKARNPYLTGRFLL